MKRTFLFVYGSLKKSKQFHQYLQGSIFIAHAKTKNIYAFIEYDRYPALVDKTDLEKLPDHLRPFTLRNIQGEIWEITDPHSINKIDKLEDHPKEYFRKEIDVISLDGFKFKELVQTYFFKKFYSLSKENSVLIERDNW